MKKYTILLSLLFSFLLGNAQNKYILKVGSKTDTSGLSGRIQKNTDSLAAHNARIGSNTTNIATNTASIGGKLDTSGNYINTIAINADALYGAATYAKTFHTGTITQNLNTQSPYQIFGTGSSTATPAFRYIDSNYFGGNWATQVRAAQTTGGGATDTTTRFGGVKSIYKAYTDSLSLASSINAKQTTPQFYGTIYNSNSFSSLSAFTQNGLTAAISGNRIALTNGSTGLDRQLYYNYYTGLFKWKMTVNYSQSNKDGSSQGIAIGVKGGVSVLAWFIGSSGGGSGKIALYQGSSLSFVKYSDAALSFSVGDSIQFSMERRGDTIVATAFNFTTKSSEITLSVRATTTNAYTHNTARFAIWNVGSSTSYINSINIFSSETKNATLLCAGDSKTVGYYATELGMGYSRNLQKYGSVVVNAGGGDNTADLLLRVPEIIALSPLQATVAIGTNDILQGLPYTTWKSNIDSIYQKLTRAGIKTYLIDGIYDTGGENTKIKNYIDSFYNSTQVIYNWQKGKDRGASSLNADNIHPNQLGHDITLNSIISSGLITGLTSPVQQDVFTGNVLFKNKSSLYFGDSLLNDNTYTQRFDMGGSYSPVSTAINAKFKIFNYNGNVDGFGESGNGLDMFSYSNQWNFVKPDGTNIGQFGLNKFKVGVQSGAVAVPTYLDLGADYNTVAGDSVNFKIKLSNKAGFGSSASLGTEYWNGSHTFFSGIGSGGGSFKNLRLETTGEMILQKGGTFTNTGDLLQVSGTALITGAAKAASFIKSGGTASQFLKADGSVDAGTYVAIVKGQYSTTAAAMTTFTVTIGTTMANNTYNLAIAPTTVLAGASYYISAKTTTTFDVTYLTAITGAVSFDWTLFK